MPSCWDTRCWPSRPRTTCSPACCSARDTTTQRHWPQVHSVLAQCPRCCRAWSSVRRSTCTASWNNPSPWPMCARMWASAPARCSRPLRTAKQVCRTCTAGVGYRRALWFFSPRPLCRRLPPALRRDALRDTPAPGPTALIPAHPGCATKASAKNSVDCIPAKAIKSRRAAFTMAGAPQAYTSCCDKSGWSCNTA